MYRDKILLLGNPKLYEICQVISQDELPDIKPVIQDLHDVLMDFRSRRGAGRAIAAPQIGVQKRLIYLNLGEPQILINPVLFGFSDSMIEIWDDCLCFPDLLVKVKRHETCSVRYRDESWQMLDRTLDSSLSELLQHECDHLDEILATQRAIDLKSFKWRE